MTIDDLLKIFDSRHALMVFMAIVIHVLWKKTNAQEASLVTKNAERAEDAASMTETVKDLTRSLEQSILLIKERG